MKTYQCLGIYKEIQMIFQVLFTGKSLAEWLGDAKNDALPKGSQLVSADVNFDAGQPVVKLNFMNYKPEILDKYAEKIEGKPPILRLMPNWSEKQPVDIEEIKTAPKITVQDVVGKKSNGKDFKMDRDLSIYETSFIENILSNKELKIDAKYIGRFTAEIINRKEKEEILDDPNEPDEKPQEEH